MEIEVKDNNKVITLSSKLVLSADGSDSKLAKKFGFNQKVSPYKRTAIVANIRCEKDHENSAYERFTESGPLAFLPFDKKVMAMVLVQG